MRRILLFVVLILGGLILTGGSPVKKRVMEPSNRDVFIKGKLVFKYKGSIPIKFWIEGNKGYYSLIIFEENGTTLSKQLKNVSDSVDIVFKDSISLSTTNTVFYGEKRYYVVIDFDNKKIEDKKLKDLIPFGYRVVKKLQDKTGGKVSGYFIIQL